MSPKLQQALVPGVNYDECQAPYTPLGESFTEDLTLCYGNMSSGEGDSCLVSSDALIGHIHIILMLLQLRMP